MTATFVTVPLTMAWRVLRFRMLQRPPIWTVAANISNKQSRTANTGWSSSLGVGRGRNNSSPQKKKNVTKNSQLSDLDTDRIDIFLNNHKLFSLLYSHITSATLIPSPLPAQPLPSTLKQKKANFVENFSVLCKVLYLKIL